MKLITFLVKKKVKNKDNDFFRESRKNKISRSCVLLRHVLQTHAAHPTLTPTPFILFAHIIIYQYF